MSGINKVILIGKLGKDPEVRATSSGTSVANFSLATSRQWKDKDGQKQEETQWHNIVVWGRTAELCGEYLAKGKSAYIEGYLQTRSYEKNGEKRYSTEVVAEDVLFLTPKDQSPPKAETSKPQSDDIPF